MIKERVIQLIEFKKFSKEDFFTKIGMSSANFRGSARNTPLNSTAIENILSEIPELNVEWLISGKGEMLLENREKAQKAAEGSEDLRKIIALLEDKVKLQDDKIDLLTDKSSKLERENNSLRYENESLKKELADVAIVPIANAG